MPTAKNKTNDDARVSFYIPGNFPSAAELTSHLSLFHGVLTWSGIALIPDPDSHYGKEPEPLAWKIRSSYLQFLRDKYEAPVLYGVSIISDVKTVRRRQDHNRDYELSVDSIIRAYVNSRGLPKFRIASGETNVDLSDFFEWSVEYFGSQSLPVDAIDTSGSIEILFQLAPFLAIIGLQDCPTTKAVVLHAVDVLKALIGKKKPSSLPPLIKLPKSVRDVIVQYDDVELKSNPDGSWSVRLQRNSANKSVDSVKE